MSRPVQYFTPDYLEACKKMSPLMIVQFLEEFRILAGAAQTKKRQRLISIRIPEELLGAFRTKCKLEGVQYQSKIKELMRQWMSQETLD